MDNTSTNTPTNQFPRGALVGAALLIGITMAVVAGARLTGVEPAAQVEARAEVIASRDLRFEDRAGDVVVYAVENDGSDIIEVLESGSNGFLRSVLRGLARARRAEGVGADVPFRLDQLADGDLILVDPATQQSIYLRAFGPTNNEAFARLLTAKSGGDQS